MLKRTNKSIPKSIRSPPSPESQLCSVHSVPYLGVEDVNLCCCDGGCDTDMITFLKLHVLMCFNLNSFVLCLCSSSENLHCGASWIPSQLISQFMVISCPATVYRILYITTLMIRNKIEYHLGWFPIMSLPWSVQEVMLTPPRRMMSLVRMLHE